MFRIKIYDPEGHVIASRTFNSYQDAVSWAVAYMGKLDFIGYWWEID